MADSAYGGALAELAGIRRRLEEGRLEPGEVEKLVVRAKQVVEAGRNALRRAEAAVEVLKIER